MIISMQSTRARALVGAPAGRARSPLDLPRSTLLPPPVVRCGIFPSGRPAPSLPAWGRFLFVAPHTTAIKQLIRPRLE